MHFSFWALTTNSGILAALALWREGRHPPDYSLSDYNGMTFERKTFRGQDTRNVA